MAKSKKKTIRREQEVEPVVTNKTRRREVVEATDNRSLISRVIIAILLLIGLYLLFNFISGQRDDNGKETAKGDDKTSQVKDSDKTDDKKSDKKTDDAASEEQANGTVVEETDKDFNFTVGGGESYTTMARRAVAATDSKLTQAERVAAESKLVSEASAEWLNEGQSLTLSKGTVKAAVDWAKALSAEEKAAWQPYADLIAW